jgi:hypothetical protein
VIDTKLVRIRMTFDVAVPLDYDPDRVGVDFSYKHLTVCDRRGAYPEPIEGAYVDDWDRERAWELQ